MTLAATACASDPAKKWDPGHTDTDIPDVQDAQDVTDTTTPEDASDVDELDTSDAPSPQDAIDADDTLDSTDTSDVTDADIDPGPQLCPADLRDSCMFSTLSCFGTSAAPAACAHFEDTFFNREWDTVDFTSGSSASYWIVVNDGKNYGKIEAFSPDDDFCYEALGLSPGTSARDWQVHDRLNRIFEIELTDDTVTITCPDGELEICSRNRFAQFFAFPNEWPQDCPTKSPDDQCALDSECTDGTLCCALSDSAAKQCLDQETCIARRPPVLCDTDVDCPATQVCSKCTRSGQRECVPETVAADPQNGLGCVQDACTAGDGTCNDPQTCCLFNNVFTCSVPSECDTPPDPNPICSPSSTNPCTDSTQECCFVSQLNQFRCLDNLAACQTAVCFGDPDCPSNHECCGYNADANIAGTCKPSCEGAPTTCADHDDCPNGDGYCCMLPGYNVGQCVIQQTDCDFQTCSDTSECMDTWICCDAAPLSQSVCTPPDQCPPTL